MIEVMIERALKNPETPEWAATIIKSIGKQVAEGRVPTPKQYTMIYRNFRTKADKNAIRAIYVARKAGEPTTD